MMPTSSCAMLPSPQYPWPTQGFHFLKHTTHLPASGLCTGWSHCLGRAGPGSLLGWFLFILQVSTKCQPSDVSPMALSKLGPSLGFLCISISRDLVCLVHLYTSRVQPSQANSGSSANKC